MAVLMTRQEVLLGRRFGWWLVAWKSLSRDVGHQLKVILANGWIALLRWQISDWLTAAGFAS